MYSGSTTTSNRPSEEVTVRNDISRQWAFLTPFVSGGGLSTQARQVEAAGMAGIVCPQVFGSPFVPLSHCAAVTSRVSLLSGVVPAFARSPFETAFSAMDLDRLSDGRFILGLGASYREWHENWFGLPGWGSPVDRLRETIEVIRLIIAESHTGRLDRFEGRYHHHDWSRFPGAGAPPLRTNLPIWIAAYQAGLVRLAGTVADGLMTGLWPVEWTLNQGLPTLLDALSRAGRSRSDIHWQAAYFVAVNDDRAEALHDARPTIALYAGIAQLEPFFTAQGFEKEALACRTATAAGDRAAAAGAVTDEMVEAFVILGPADECRKRFEPVWEVADSFLLVPPVWGLTPGPLASYAGRIAETFYG
jgi:alkanesulfonate monooxygenase SsuD/methylene tetrahydromethanopterin reductase-like flavin-dependent oxidoreductase (luciferase family)